VKLITTTLAHAGAASKLAGAIASAPWADAHLVIDTTPNEPEVLNAGERIRALNRSAYLVREIWPWRNDFAAARNESLEFATRSVTQMPVRHLANDVFWALTLDSDERLICADPEALRAELAATEADVAMAFYVDGNYQKERAFRLPTTARWVGRTHECAIGWRLRHTLTSLRFTEEGKDDAGNRAKWERDERLLLLETADNPRDDRWWYYLGDTYTNLGKPSLAVDAFLRCADLKGWDEQGAWACYRAAKILIAEAENWPVWEEKRAKLQNVLEICCRGLALHPCFPELCRFAALACFWRGESAKATAWARMAVAIGDYRGCRCSRHRHSFRDVPSFYELPFDVLKFSEETEAERAVAAVEQNAARYARWGGEPQRIAIDRNHPARWEARGDLGRCSNPLEKLLKFSSYPLEHVGRADYANMNPSLCVHEGRILCVVRTVNYHIDDKGNYVSLPEDEGVIKTENWFGEIVTTPGDCFLDILNVRPIVDVSDRETFATRVLGYEDMRPISIGGQLYACATVRDSRLDMRCEMAVCKLATLSASHVSALDLAQLGVTSPSDELDQHTLDDLIELQGVGLCHCYDNMDEGYWLLTDAGRRAYRIARTAEQCVMISRVYIQRGRAFENNQKNWMPMDMNGQLCLVHHCDPTTVAKWNHETGQCDTASITTPEGFAIDHLRGGSQAVAVDDGWIAVTHEVVFVAGKRAYLHRFVRFDTNLRIVGVSPTWYLEALQVEFCAGMCRLDDKRLLLGFGIRDAEAKLVVVNVEDAVRACKSWKEWTA
jgi:tetratricopeptide (TPR) repeat protein